MFSSSIRQNEAVQLRRLKILSHLRTDLESVRLLVELIRKREKEKLKIVRLQMDYLYMHLAPLNCLIRRTLEEIRKLDPKQVFWFPVREEDVPDYYDIIKRPMFFTTIQDKIDNFEYDSIEAFEVSNLFRLLIDILVGY
jgi:hypothetical protein